jgi:hypothetical protein
MSKTTIAGFDGVLVANSDGTITFHFSEGGKLTGPDREGIEECLTAMHNARERRARWPKDTKQAMTILALMFPTLRDADGIRPWDPEKLISWLNGPAPGSGARSAGRFVLGVWNSSTDWTEHGLAPPGRFDLFEALAVWDDTHREALQAWVSAPFWP